MKQLVLPTIVLFGLGTGAAQATDAANGTPGGPVTILHLGVEGTVHETPDLLSVDLGGSVSAADPASAQRQLDARMKSATNTAEAAKGVEWRVAGYGVDQTAPDAKTRTIWTAHQTLHLESTDSEALLGLVGKLQAAGLTVDSLEWVLSPAHQQAAEARATVEALKLLRVRADEAAKALGLKVQSIRSVTLPEAGRVRPMPMMRMMAAAPVAPMASRTDADISQDAQGEIVLTP
ncbi:SIMPL domain-containing protein [Acetobacteraceae bacterium KSS8]|uniref:SIMPL domain-containing protein n=1 Tax=Endosaccharibacter trunci TaxID=2812733 RepID=A0ABT1W669_9PROT|nr:SIMPL domain-containing protein [Acetobacteraceae bacterium KSS8]